MLQLTARLEPLWETLKRCNNQLMIYNSNAASKPTAAKKPAFYWKEQAPGPPPCSLAGPRMSGIKASPPQLAPTERSLIETRPRGLPDPSALRIPTCGS